MRLITANIKCNPVMRQSRVEHDIAAVKAAGGIILWQEIEIFRYTKALHDVGPKHWQHANTNLEIPISVDSHYWEIVKDGYRLTHKGRALTSPDRYISWAFVRNKHTGQKLVLVNTHFISGAWGSKAKTFRSWRQQMWRLHYAILKEMVTGWHQAGFTVIGGGDWNKTKVDKFHPDQVWLATSGIDKLFVLPGSKGPKVQLTGVDAIHDVFTDHTPRIALLKLLRRPA